MNRQYQYYAMLNDIRPSLDDPGGVIRRWTDEEGRHHDERYSRRLLWEPTGDLVMVENGHPGVVAHPIPAEAATAFEAIQYARVHRDDPVDGKFSYFALVTDDHSLDDPKTVVRTWVSPTGGDQEAWHIGGPGYGWERSHVREDNFRGRDRGDLVPIDEETAARLIGPDAYLN